MKAARWVRHLIPHLTISLSVVFAALLVLDYFNPLMAFTSNEVSTPLLALFCLLSFANSILSLWLLGSRDDAAERRRHGATGALRKATGARSDGYHPAFRYAERGRRKSFRSGREGR